MTEVPIEYSRPILLAEEVRGASPLTLLDRLRSFRIEISVDERIPGAHATANFLRETLSRLPWTVCEVDPSREPQGGLSVRIHIGTKAPRGVVRGIPEGYGGHVATDSRISIRHTRPANGLACFFTAALLAAEAFKVGADVPNSKMTRRSYTRFCPVSLTDDLAAAPELKSTDTVNLTLVGLGAVGTGHVLALSQLPLRGRVVLIDSERFGPENVGTYSFGGPSDALEAPWKVDLAARLLTEFELVPWSGTVERFVDALEAGQVPWTPHVLVGLDSIEARHAAQRIWPHHLIDAATGGTAVGLREALATGPCMACLLPRPASKSAVEELAARTGLPSELLAQGTKTLDEEHLALASHSKREALRAHLGKSICGLGDAFGLSNLHSQGYRPAIPFVSQQAAALGVGRLLARVLGMEPQSNSVHYDALLGPHSAAFEAFDPLAECYCQQRRSTIARVVESRSSVASTRGK